MRFGSVAAGIWLAVGMTACSAEDTTIDNERTSIERYLSSQHYEDVETIGGGVYRYVINRDREDYATSPAAEQGNTLIVNYSLYTFSSSSGEGTLLYTNNPDLQAAAEGLNPEFWTEDPFTIELGRTKLLAGLQRGLPGVRQGDTLKLFLSSDVGYGDSPYGVMAANTPLVWNLGIRKVIKQ